jgi:hypothetical protein
MGVIIKPSPGPMGVVKPVFGVKPPKPGPVLGVVLPPKPILGIVINHDHDHDHDWWWWHHHHERPWFVEGGYPVSAPVAVTGPIATAPAPANGPCTCLTKTYLNDGSVKFTDVCTKETAIATPNDLRAQQ